MNTNFNEYANELNKSVTNFEKEKGTKVENIIFNEYDLSLHNMKQEEMSKIIDKVFCDPDLKCLLNYEKELYGANRAD